MSAAAPVSDEVAREGIRLAYDAYDREERSLWEPYAESRRLFPDGRNYIRGTGAARRELRRRVEGEIHFAREARAA